MGASIILVEYDSAWPALFDREAARIRHVLGDRALRIEHVGSTAVPALAAKPIIDILLVVADSVDEAAYLPSLETAGYVLHIREPKWYEHRLLKGPDTAVNVHCFSAGCSEIQRMLAFRDRLRSSEADRLLYERTKRELTLKTWDDVQQYADAKSAVVKQILAEAILQEVRLYIFRQTAETARVPQPPEIAAALSRDLDEVNAAVKQLAVNRVLILAPNDGNIWAANPFCAVPSGFRVRAARRAYSAICIWDALGVAAALHQDAVIEATCGDCGDPMRLEVVNGTLMHAEGLIHFAVPAHHWWDNIGFT